MLLAREVRGGRVMPTSIALESLRRAAVVLASVAAMLLPATAVAAPAADQAATPPTPPSSEATLAVFNRDIITFRSPAAGISAADRARRAQGRIDEQLDIPGPHAVSSAAHALGTLIQIDGATSFVVTAEDVDKLQQETQEAVARRAVAALSGAIEATHESRSLRSILRAVAIAAVATIALLALLWVLHRTQRALESWIVRVTQAHSERLRVSGIELIRRDRLAWIVHAVVLTTHRLISLLLLYEWVSLVLAQFPYTKVWGLNLNAYLLRLAGGIGGGILGALPGLFTAVVIYFIARFVARMLDGFFDRMLSGPVPVSWLDADIAMPTRRLAKAVIWLFAFAMAYPYLPGAQTDAFKGLSVIVGLMISLGASNLVGQAGAGLILTYARVFRRGEYVAIGEHEGTVTELGMFATRIRTGLGVELTLSNLVVISAVTKNYSRAVKGPGFVLDTIVTIGYDTPWRQVEAMLVEAAHRTAGVLADPAPKVFQTGLSDFYPEYRLVCQAIPSEPRPRALVLSALHANIQDVFNEYGVQIMSPHYFADPATPKSVPKEQWFPAPVKPPAP
jgi:small-conductance mechanosensitive channel